MSDTRREPNGCRLLLQSGGYLLLESGGQMVLESWPECGGFQPFELSGQWSVQPANREYVMDMSYPHLKPTNLQPKPVSGGTTIKAPLVPKHSPQGGGAPGTGSKKK